MCFSIHLNVKQLMQDNFITAIESHLLATNISSKLIEFKLSELDLIAQNDTIMHKLTLLHHLGFKVAIDDFGTGFSSLSSLSLLTVSTVMMNHSCTENVLNEQNKQVIVNAIVKLSEPLNLTVVAKGVDNKQQLDFLVAKGCKQFQGHYIGASLTFDSFKSLLESEKYKFNK
jgi:EAL domain-containing protein (putative c-di-GMP-specific phosphodiesterase class I)